jgi:fucose 4-O-acetylase-like acetyltransferase
MGGEMAKVRNAYWDNLKALLIFCVVLGHFLLPIHPKGDYAITTFFWLYSFHMPAFVFVSGYFSRSFVRKDNKEQKLIGFLCLYLLLTFGIWLAAGMFGKPINYKDILSTPSAQWYMLAMCFWYLVIPYVSKLKKGFAFVCFVLLGILVGCYPSCGNFLVLSRTIVFFPFFLAGYHFGGLFPKNTKVWMKILAAAFLVGCACFIFFFRGDYSNAFALFYADRGYANMDLSDLTGCLYRLIWYLAAMAMVLALMCLMPQKRYTLTYIGERTLAIYIVHRILRDIFRNLGLYEILPADDLMQVIVCVLIAFAVVLVTSIKPISKFLDTFFHLSFPICSNQNTGENHRP